MIRVPRLRRARWRGPCALTAAAAVAAVAGLAGCGSSGSGGSSGLTNFAGAPTVTVWTWRSQDVPLWKTVQTDLAKQGTKVNIQLRVLESTSYDSVTQTAMDGGQGPDIFYDRAGYGTETYAAAGLIKPLNGLVNVSDIPADALKTAEYDGKLYGVPYAIETMSVFYNKTVLAQNKISVPSTWSQFISDLKTLKKNNVTPMYVMGVQQWMMSLELETIGASTMSDSFTQELTDQKANYTSAPYVKTLAAFQQLSPYLENDWQAVGSADNEQETALALGKTGFVIDGTFDVPLMTQVNPAVQLGQFLMPSPTGIQPKIEWYPDGDISLNAHIANKAVAAAAQKVVAFTSSPAFGNALSAGAGEISPIQGTHIPAKYPMAVQADQWYRSQPIDPIAGIRSPMDTPTPNAAALKANKSPSAYDNGIYTAEQNIVVPLMEGKLTPAQAASQVQKAEAWYFNGTSS
jgi:multiple sugar transport system substrate-binding protein/raffinose/stachyose/melibiose transport system substrate-binding protein